MRDYYKYNETMVPYEGGVIIILVALICFSILSVFFKPSNLDYVILTIISIFGFYGVLDDIIDIRHIYKLLLPYFFSLPLFHYLNVSDVVFPFGKVNIYIFYLFIVPVYVMVVSNLVNMHSGYNGLASGLSLILLIFLILKSYSSDNLSGIASILSITGATLGFFYYEHYPSKIFWGNSGALGVGAAIGILIVSQGFFVSGFVMLLPHVINFLMYVYWRIRKLPKVKFGKVNKDGILIVPNRLTLKWVLPYYFKLTEKQATYAMYALTLIFSFIGFWIPY